MFKRKAAAEASRRQVTLNRSRPAAFSYHANRAEQDYNLGRTQPRDQDIRRRERLVRFWRQRLGVLVASLLIIFCVFDILHLSASPKVIILSSSSNQSYLRSSSVYQQAAAKLFASSLLNANKITVNTSEVEQKLQQEFPELAQVSVTLPLISHRPIVYIAPTTPSLVLNTQGNSYVLSSNGTVLLAADTLSGTGKQNLPTVTDDSNRPVTIGTEALPSVDITFIQTVVEELEAKGVTPASLRLPSAAYELDVQPAGVSYYVKFNMHDTGNGRTQAGTYLAIRDRLQQQAITPAQYIDVRLVGRAYYK